MQLSHAWPWLACASNVELTWPDLLHRATVALQDLEVQGLPAVLRGVPGSREGTNGCTRSERGAAIREGSGSAPPPLRPVAGRNPFGEVSPYSLYPSPKSGPGELEQHSVNWVTFLEGYRWYSSSFRLVRAQPKAGTGRYWYATELAPVPPPGTPWSAELSSEYLRYHLYPLRTRSPTTTNAHLGTAGG
jgi:hypothetical protein